MKNHEISRMHWRRRENYEVVRIMGLGMHVECLKGRNTNFNDRQKS
jgi:hypothetical protein